MSKAISVGCTSSAKLTFSFSNTSRIGSQRLAKSAKPLSRKSWLVGGNAYSACQMEEPVKPLTTADPWFFCRGGIEKFSRGAGGGLHFFGGALADAFRFAVAPDVGGQNGLVPFVNQIAHGLADEVGGDGAKHFRPCFASSAHFFLT
jgi:hypothetical protein